MTILRKEDCLGCNWYIKDKGSDKEDRKIERICGLVKRKHYKYISERCPCQLCLVKLTCKMQTSERYIVRQVCGKFSDYFISVFRWSRIKVKNRGKVEGWAVRHRIIKSFKFREINAKNSRLL